MNEIKKELMSLERQGWTALTKGEGRTFYGEMLADEAIVVVPGAVLDKEQTLASWDVSRRGSGTT